MTGTSKEYAVALFELAEETGAEGEILNGLRFAMEVFDKTPGFTEFLSSPAVSKSLRLETISEAFGDDTPEYVSSFISLLCEKGEMGSFAECAAEYEKLYDSKYNIVYALVTSAVPLSEEEKARLSEKLAKKSKARVEIEYKTDSSLIGGIVIETDGTVFDGSIRHRLKTIKEEVMDK